MAPATPSAGLADQLVASLLLNEVAVPKLRKQKDAFARKLRTHNYARTNQFEVAERLDGLQEKLQIFNNDELADALHIRLVKLKHHSKKWLPDILDLLLRLSDDPTSKTRIECLANIGSPSVVVPSLTWAEIEAGDPVDRKNQIWRFAEYSDLSSDDDVVEAGPASPKPESTVLIREEQGISLEEKLEPVDPDLGQEALDRLRGDQFWQNVSSESLELTELQVIREVLFMLQGFPTALFWKVGDRYEIDQRFCLKNSSRESFVNALSEFGRDAIRLDLLRSFAKKAQSECLTQTLRMSLEGLLQDIDSQLYSLEQNILAVECEAATTILGLSAAVSDIVAITGALAEFIAKVQPKSVNIVQCLEVLFDRVCEIQASGDEPGFQCLSRLFFQCFETYFRPLQDWMDRGTLPEKQATIFVAASCLHQDPSGLWQMWFELADDSAPNRCPNFLKSVKAQMFNIGKTVVFLQRLNACSDAIGGPSMLMTSNSAFTNGSSLLPFSELLMSSVQEFVDSRLQIATSRLRDHLGNNCGLWKTLDALNAIHFGQNGYITDLVDTKLFTAIDRCDKNWNDRFLLRALLQTVLEPIESVELERLALKPKFFLSRNLAHRRQSVKLLKDFSLQYILHWSVANVITIPSLISYSRVSTFLTQIRRARYMLERRSLFQVRRGRPNATPQERSLNQLLHHNLLLFINILYSHLTTLVIAEANSRLRQDLANAADIDAMIAAHSKYCNELEETCLTSKNLKPIHNEIISILDLCIRFSDLNSPTKSRRSSDADAHSYVSATSHQRRRRGDEADSSSDDGGGSDEGDGYSAFILPEKSSLVEQLRKVRDEFEKHLSFVVAGLNSIGRVREEGTYWKILGSRLDWKRSTL